MIASMNRGRAVLLPLALIVILAVSSGCSSTKGGGAANPSSAVQQPAVGADPVAQMFVANRAQLKPPDERLKAALSAGVAGFITPIGGSASQTVTIDFTVKNADVSGDLVVLSMIPYQVGDPAQGGVTRFEPVKNASFNLKAGESKPVSIEVIRIRASSPGGGGQQPPVARAVQSGGEAQPAGGGPFEPATGLQVLFVAQFAGAVPSDAWQQVTVVPPDQFAAKYGMYMGYQIGIGIPPEQIA